METRTIAPRGMVVTPHHLATQSALAILREGGTAIEATVAAAATLAVVYPHMNSIGGDSFWLITPPTGDPIVIEACGPAGSLANINFYEGLKKIPNKGPKAACTVAGTIGGWQEALDYVNECGYQRLSTAKLLADAISYADNGFPVSLSFEVGLKEYINKEIISEDFKAAFLKDGRVARVGEKICQKNLGKTLRLLAKHGLNSFYRGEVAKLIEEDIRSLGMPITASDLKNYTAIRRLPLHLKLKCGEVYNTPPPTQGLASLAILGILEEFDISGQNDGVFIHTTVEATKEAFKLRDKYVTDPCYMKIDPQKLLSSQNISMLAQNINLDQASMYQKSKGDGDTIWMGVMDNKGFSVSFIQSIYQSFGSGVVLPQTGITWHNRGISFSLNETSIISLKPGKKPLHTLNPAAAKLNDGRVIVYGTRGGDGQPQTQAAIFHRYVFQNIPMQRSVAAPRWLYGRTVDEDNDKLKIEGRFSYATLKYLKDKGHNVEMISKFSEIVGHAGMLVRHSDGMMEGASDPRSDGSAAGF